MTLKAGDKLVLKIDDEQAAELNASSSTNVISSQILGKLSKFTKSERIKFSEEEMEEFNDIRSRANELLKALMVIMKSCTYYPHLKRWILEEDHPLPRNEREILFAKVWENPELIEVVKEKRYCFPLGLKTSDGRMQYLSCKYGCYFASRRDNKLKQTFTESETRTLHLTTIDLEKCKMEVK
jgi:hypothetical protein